MRVSICVGNYSEIPYYVKGLDAPVYCIEELCFCLKENAFLLDTSVMDGKLVQWIERECGLRELASELDKMVRKQGSLSSFVTLIQEYVGLYDEEQIEELNQLLKKGAGLSNLEKRKSQVDYLVRKRKYTLALEGYEELLGQLKAADAGGAEPPAVRSAILHNMGVAYVGLMLYEQAAAVFEGAYAESGSPLDLKALLAVKRLQLKQEDYVAYVAGHPDYFEASLALEKEVDGLLEEWQYQGDYMRLKERLRYRDEGDLQRYYDENDRMTQALKDSYRHSVDCLGG